MCFSLEMRLVVQRETMAPSILISCIIDSCKEIICNILSHMEKCEKLMVYILSDPKFC